MKNYLRKRRHLRYISKMENELVRDLIDLAISSHLMEFNETTANKITNTGLLLRKYSRRRRLIEW